MPLNEKGKKIMKSMKKTYDKEAKAGCYASKNKGGIKGVEKKKRTTRGNRKKTKREWQTKGYRGEAARNGAYRVCDSCGR